MPLAPALSAVSPGCFKVVTGTTAIEVCGQEPDPGWIKYANVATAGGSLMAGVGAAVVAYWTFSFMRSQGQQARTDSVRDDYWLRTVVSPTSIVPFQDFIARLGHDLPTSNPPPSKTELSTFFAKAADEFNDYSRKFKTLALIDAGLNAAVETALQNLEEIVAIYVGKLVGFVDGASPAPSRPDAVSALSDGMVALFRLIQDHQVRVPLQGKGWWSRLIGR